MRNNDLYKKVFEWMNKNPDKVIKMSIQQIANENYTVPSTITKTLNFYGYSGIKGFRKFIKDHSVSYQMIAKDRLDQVKNNIFEGIMEPEFTDQLGFLTDDIKDAKNIYISGLGHSLTIAHTLQRIIIRKLGKIAIIFDGTYMRDAIKKDDLLIIISLNLNSELLNILVKLKEFKSWNSWLITSKDPKFTKKSLNQFTSILRLPEISNGIDDWELPIIKRTFIEFAFLFNFNFIK